MSFPLSLAQLLCMLTGWVCFSVMLLPKEAQLNPRHPPVLGHVLLPKQPQRAVANTFCGSDLKSRKRLRLSKRLPWHASLHKHLYVPLGHRWFPRQAASLQAATATAVSLHCCCTNDPHSHR